MNCIVYFQILVYPDGRVCISILHAPGDDPMVTMDLIKLTSFMYCSIYFSYLFRVMKQVLKDGVQYKGLHAFFRQ